MFQNEADIVKVIIAGTSLLLFFAVMIIWFVVAYRKRHEKHLAEKERMQALFQKELLMAQLEIQEQTLKNISQEIHDNIGQTLSLAKLNLTTWNMESGTGDFQKAMMAKELVSKAIVDLRSLSKILNKDHVLAAGFLNALAYELQLIRNAAGIQTDLNSTGPALQLEAHKELFLFRMVQEALHNIIKHAQARHVEVNVDHTGDWMQLSITDDGCGFDENALRVGIDGGSGLQNMRNRIAMVGGVLDIKSGAGHGTTITIRLSTG